MVKRKLSTTPPLSVKAESSTAPVPPPSPQKAKKLKIQHDYATESPFPDFPHPTHADATRVHELLTEAHGARVRRTPDASSSANSAKTCGSVPNVIESLIGIILSQNTSGKNSSGAKRSLDSAFGRNNFAAIADAPVSAVVDAIRSGGLANKKAATIQRVLRAIKEKHGAYSLQHLADVRSDGEIMRELMAYDGVGPKTASCVLLFCLGRASFAVDTHVFRLSKLLGWVPARADRVQTQAHLDLRIPDDLKYGLHVLMIQHGRTCTGCKTKGKGSCILKAYLKERGRDVDAAVEEAATVKDETT
ncbi:DNA glycosylase [Schizophyllum amplum]|uniref:DNA glycosylase n=1 Tax=Schizophyllum amplum TaxID=97359 RepID=A0A550CWL7_9AGAR|nr:DNA glycosylase [Auriculariopsis ampla]